MTENIAHPNPNLKILIKNLSYNNGALVSHAQKDEILNNRELYSGEYSFSEDQSGMYLVSLVVLSEKNHAPEKVV